jgi:hypothetical protein
MPMIMLDNFQIRISLTMRENHRMEKRINLML